MIRRLLLTTIALLLATSAASSPAQAEEFARMVASGSSWAAPAIDQWSRDVRDQGIVIDYSPVGSAAGRTDYSTGAVDFAGSDIAFLNGQDKIAGGVVETSQYSYSYLPITAGGTAFMYHLTVGGEQVRNLRLSGESIAKIFTGQITNWSDPQITEEYGAQLPDLPIKPVVRAEPSGATYQFTAWLAHEYREYWNELCQSQAGVDPPCGASERFPAPPSFKPANGSTAVANTITSSTGEGTIGYDEYAYALAADYPVVKVLNPAGYYVLPTASNVAIALQKAKIDWNQNSKTYLMQDLRSVYGYQDPRSYPLSSYSYLVVPSTNKKLGDVNDNFTDEKGATLSTWANYFLCAGQQSAESLGYSPLPRPLIQGGIIQVNRIPGGIDGLNPNKLEQCNNPTMRNGQNILLETAPMPGQCDKKGAPLYGCDPNTGTGNNGSTNNGPDTSGGQTGGAVPNQPADSDADEQPTQAPQQQSTTPTNTTQPQGDADGPAQNQPQQGQQPAAPNQGQVDKPTSKPKTDPDTGQVIDSGTENANVAAGVPAQAVIVEPRGNEKWLFTTLTALELLAAVTIPPILGGWLARHRHRRRGKA